MFVNNLNAFSQELGAVRYARERTLISCFVCAGRDCAFVEIIISQCVDGLQRVACMRERIYKYACMAQAVLRE